MSDDGPKTNPSSPSGFIRAAESYRREAVRVAVLVEQLGRDRASSAGAVDMGIARLANQLRELAGRFYRWGGAEPRTGKDRETDVVDLARLCEEARTAGATL